ncbi:hypothetical protein [Gemmobacter nectariphilus]|uniref:hypothetical protein n=1 Tax=Gemmobacter nectariphilus TaxID=220343 RepID=UPI000422589D|nr:hypothetical protein [Gemmobacter nectariphilus]
MKWPLPALVVLALLAGCTDGPSLSAGVRIAAGGVSVHPAISGRVGGVRVAVSP